MPRCPNVSARARRSGLIVFAAALVGCAAPRGPLSVRSDDPDVKFRAVKIEAETGNFKGVDQLVKDLSSDDPAVRFYAWQGLRRLTGNDYGYRYWADAADRKPAVERWRQWLAGYQGGRA